MPTITTRLTLWYLAIFGGTLIALVAVIFTVITTNDLATFDRDLYQYSHQVLEAITEEDTTTESVMKEIAIMSDSASLRFRAMSVILAGPDTLVSSLASADSVAELLKDFRKQQKDDPAEAFKTLELGERHFRAYRVPMTGPGDLRSTLLVVVTSLERQQERLEMSFELLVLLVPLGLVAAGVGGWFLARRALLPVAQLTKTASGITSSNLNRRVPIGASSDELSRLAATFNEMIARLESTFTSQRQFVADASHDLRTPLSVVQAELELLQSQYPDDPTMRQAIQRSEREVGRLSALANDLLILARADAGQLLLSLEPIRLDELVVAAVASLGQLAAQRNVSMRIDIGDAVEIVGDEKSLARAVANVLDNAIKFSPEGKAVEVSLERVDSLAIVSVSDHGPGIRPEDLSRTFDRFYRSDRARHTKGTGLGMAIVKAIVDAHGARVTLDSVVDQGTSVTMRFPLHSPSQT